MKKYTRKEMIAIMEIRGFSPRTISIYINHMRNFAEYFNKAPHALTPEHIHKYQLFLVQEKQISWSFFNQAVCAMRFFLTMWSVTTGLSSTYHSGKSIKNFPSFSPSQRSFHCSL